MLSSGSNLIWQSLAIISVGWKCARKGTQANSPSSDYTFAKSINNNSKSRCVMIYWDASVDAIMRPRTISHLLTHHWKSPLAFPHNWGCHHHPPCHLGLSTLPFVVIFQWGHHHSPLVFSFLLGTLLVLMWMSLSTAASMTASLLSSEAATVVGQQQSQQIQVQHQQQHLMGPVFLDEPPARTHFSNSTGAVITCLATSSLPPVKVWWVLANDAQTAVFDVPGLRLVRPNGQLVFPPFQALQYRQDVHSTVSYVFLYNLMKHTFSIRLEQHSLCLLFSATLFLALAHASSHWCWWCSLIRNQRTGTDVFSLFLSFRHIDAWQAIASALFEVAIVKCVLVSALLLCSLSPFLFHFIRPIWVHYYSTSFLFSAIRLSIRRLCLPKWYASQPSTSTSKVLGYLKILAD